MGTELQSSCLLWTGQRSVFTSWGMCSVMSGVVASPLTLRWFDSARPAQAAAALRDSAPLKHFSFAPPVLEVINRALPQLASTSDEYDLTRTIVTHPHHSKEKQWKHLLVLDVRFASDGGQMCREMGERTAYGTGRHS